MKEMNSTELQRIYSEANNSLERHLAEIRSNILLNAGFHYSNKNRWSNIRNIKGVSNDKKIRVTKNHTGRICRKITNSLLEAGIDVGVFPRNESEQGDQKTSELHASVWEWIKDENKWDKKKLQVVSDFVVSGETFFETIYDPSKGMKIGEEKIIAEDGITPIGVKPVYSGKVEINRLFAFNVLTDPQAKSFDECRYVIVKKLFPTKELKKKYEGDEEKLRYLDEADDTLRVFDGLSGTYSESKDHTQVNCFYYRPCEEYPTGHYYFATSTGILEEGELYRFPITFCGYEEHQTSSRAYGPIKQIRPYQNEINRCASKIVEESIVLGPSYILSQAGTKITNSSIGNGMRNVVYQGMKPEIQPGRTGVQYVDYMNALITELYQISEVQEMDEDKPGYANDTYSMLFRSLKQKKRYVTYGTKLENFFIETAEIALDLAQAYLPDETVIAMVGKDEQVNVSEFRATNSLARKIKIEPRSEDFTSTLGRSLAINTLLQYAGSNLNPEQIGQLAKYMPFLNKDQLTDEFTIKTDLATNTILALDRGEQPQFINRHHEYMIEKLSARTVKPDFGFLDPVIQQNYEARLAQHQQAMVEQQREAAMAKQGFIPTTGGLTGVDLYEENEEGKQKRVRLPNDALKWLIDKLASQGSSIQAIDDMDLADQAAIGRGVGQIQQPQPRMGNGQLELMQQQVG